MFSRSMRFSGRTALGLAVVISLGLHVVLTPVAGLLGALSWLVVDDPRLPDKSEPLKSIEIDLTWMSPESVSPASEISEAFTGTERPVTKAPGAATRPPKALAKPPEAPAQKKERRRHAKKKSAPVESDRLKKTPGTRSEHPVARTGISSKVVDPNANVNLLLAMEPIREHVLGPRVSRLLTELPQWRSFLGAAGLDPVQDFDRVLVVSPELRRTAEVVVVVQHLLKTRRVREAVDVLVKRPPKGRWLTTKPPAALARADRADRLFVLSADNVLVVAPPQLEKQLIKSPIRGFPMPAGSAAAVVHIRSPGQALRRAGVGLPESLQWLRVELSPTESGGAQLKISAKDESESLARTHASELSIAINAITNPNLGALGALIGIKSIAFLDPITLFSRASSIEGSLMVRPHQLRRLLAYAEGWVAQRTRRRVKVGDGTPQKSGSRPTP